MPRPKSRKTKLREAKRVRKVKTALLGFDPVIQRALEGLRNSYLRLNPLRLEGRHWIPSSGLFDPKGASIRAFRDLKFAKALLVYTKAHRSLARAISSSNGGKWTLYKLGSTTTETQLTVNDKEYKA